MIKKSLLTITSVFIFSGIVFPQDKTTKRLPSIAIGAGVLSFNGDIGTNPFSKRRLGYNFIIEQRIGKYFGVSINGLFGKLADSEISKARNLNFESKITQVDLNFIVHFGTDSTKFAPYLSAGLGFLKFNPYGDLTDADGIKYNYWQDGTIRSLPENDVNKANAIRQKRDYTYETQLKDSVTYKRNSLCVPISGGLNIRLMEKLHVKVGGTYYITFTDWIDNVKSGKNDSYIYGNVSVQYTLGKKADVNANDNVHSSTEFSELDKLDSDGDKILDTDDNCPGTPAGVKVTPDGCPIDTDEDGVPDYKDEEADTKKGAFVNEKGITQTEEMIAKRQQEFDELASQRLHDFVETPSNPKVTNNIDKTKPRATVLIPDELKSADKNTDGIISTDEIGKAIDSFFDGDSDFTVEKLNELIDLFFEQ
jgi:hypothetical protein